MKLTHVKTISLQVIIFEFFPWKDSSLEIFFAFIFNSVAHADMKIGENLKGVICAQKIL